MYSCSDCREYLPRRFRENFQRTSTTGKRQLDYSKIVDLSCGLCGSKNVESQSVSHWFFNLNQGKIDIDRFVQAQIDSTVKKYLSSQRELVDWDITRDNYEGIHIPFGREDQFLYLWFESLAGYFPELLTLDYNEFSFRHFIGKNIIYYHGTALPLIARIGLGINSFDSQISARGFLNLDESSERFRDLTPVKEVESDYLRFYLTKRTPDSVEDYTFTEEEFKDITNRLLCNGVCSSLKRAMVHLERNQPIPRFSSPRLEEDYKTSKSKIADEFANLKVHSALEKVLDYLSKTQLFFEKEKLYQSSDGQTITDVGFILATNLSLLNPFIPRITDSYNPFSNWQSSNPLNLEVFQNLRVDQKINVPFYKKI